MTPLPPASTPRSLRTWVVAMVIGILVSEILFWRVLNMEEIARQQLVLRAAMQTLCIGGLLLVIPRLPASAIGTQRLPAAVVLCGGMLVFLALFCGLLGLLRNFDLVYVAGDSFKYILIGTLPMILMLTIRDERTLELIGFWTVAILAAALTLVALAYLSGLLPLHRRLMFMYVGCYIPALCLAFEELRRRRFYRITFWYFMVFLFPVLSWYSQSLGFTVSAGFMLFFTWYFSRPTTSRLRDMAVMSTALLATLLVVLLSSPVFIGEAVDNMTSSTFYMTRKFMYVSQKGFSIETLELIGGTRVGHLVSTIRYFVDHPMEILFGQGMGGLLEVQSVSGIHNVSWKLLNHSIEGGYPEVLYRTGLIGLAVYIGLFWWLFRTGLRAAKGSRLGAMCAAYGLFVLTVSLFSFGLIYEGVGTIYIFGLLFASAQVVDRKRRAEARTGRTAAAAPAAPSARPARA